MANARRDENYVPALIAVSSSDGETIVPLYADPTTHRLLVTVSNPQTATLTSTETPNGVLKVFTFSTATAQPTFINMDGALVPATSQAGVVYWTWNGTLKQATMELAPNDILLGIV